MKRITVAFLISAATLLTGCSPIGSKSMSISLIYGATAALSLILLVGYCILLKKKELWYLLLFTSVFIVNSGYFFLSVSKSLEQALLANRISYLGSVLLPMTMLFIILNVVNIKYSRRILYLLLPVTVFVFLVAASPGYLDIYYKSVTLKNIGGVSVLCKEYGTWHPLYLFYLTAYFIAMISVIIYGKIKKKIESAAHSAILLVAVFINICIWLLEQLVNTEYEFLSLSYIITEMFLLGLHLVVQDNANRLAAQAEHSEKEYTDSSSEPPKEKSRDITDSSVEFVERCKFLAANLHTLTPTEKIIYGFYLDGMGTREIMKELSITENTLKYHNKNIYSKLGVSSRKQLLSYSAVDTLQDKQHNK